MPKLDKPFKKIDEQMEILKDRNLLFLNEEADKKRLQEYGYYEIINGYKSEFLIDKSDDEKGYKKDINFQHIFDLYSLDKEIRNVTRYALEDFEQYFKQNLAYVISRDISADQNRYTKKSHYNTGRNFYQKGKKTSGREVLLKEFKKILTSPYDPYRYYREKHENIPPWILVKGLTFGNTIYWFNLSKVKIRKAIIARMLGMDINLINIMNKELGITKAFGDILELYLDYRNLSSHVGRVYDHRSKKHKIRNYSQLIYQNDSVINESKQEFSKGIMRSSIGTVLQTLNLFENKDPYIKLAIGLYLHMKNYLKKYPTDFMFLINKMELKDTYVYTNLLKDDDLNLEKL